MSGVHGPIGGVPGPRVVSVNVGLPRAVPRSTGSTGGDGGGEVMTAIWKAPVAGRVAVRRDNLDGDRQADLVNHGGPDKAVYAYTAEDLAWWAQELGRDVPVGAFGENLTIAGLDAAGVVVGERWSIGSARLQVAQPRIPCFKLGIRFADRSLPRRFAAAGRPGIYLRVLVEGELGAGDAIDVTPGAPAAVGVNALARAYHRHDAGLAAAVLGAPDLPASWYAWARERTAPRRRDAAR
ncbi:MOSC domain-containing protein [Frankia sp. AiPs1]|uniref:MOSC domain-containing protein n=1 Tax=Frankia sp. AiPs1 TaxID=573493 RepID=UPI0020430C6A|nr:MOSC domain-containing protein [Frankia sp. AiPs1]MCM3920411.1 MOSC domain-containing protein [Frankia sp. AiPs1]